MRYIHHLIDDQKFKFVSDLDEIGHYEIINLNGKPNSGKPASETSPPSGSIATGPSRYDPESMRVSLRPPVPDFFARVMKNE